MLTQRKQLAKRHKDSIHAGLDRLISCMARDLGLPREAIATELFYRLQRHPEYGRNATDTQKNAAFAHWKGICQKCLLPVERRDAAFHHLRRAVRNQHAPCNLVPYHRHCHDNEHGAVDGSLSKGTPERKAGRVAGGNDG